MLLKLVTVITFGVGCALGAAITTDTTSTLQLRAGPNGELITVELYSDDQCTDVVKSLSLTDTKCHSFQAEYMRVVAYYDKAINYNGFRGYNTDQCGGGWEPIPLNRNCYHVGGFNGVAVVI